MSHSLALIVRLPPGAAVDRLLFAARQQEYAGGPAYTVAARRHAIEIASPRRRRQLPSGCVLRVDPVPDGARVVAAAGLAPPARRVVWAFVLAWLAGLAALPWAHRAYGPVAVVLGIVLLAAALIVMYRAAAAAFAAASSMLAFASRTLGPLEAERLTGSRDGGWRTVRPRAHPADLIHAEAPVRRVPRPTQRCGPARRHPRGRSEPR